MNAITRAFDAKTEVKEGERAVVATINTDQIDRYHTVIVPKGGRFANFLKNRVVMMNHGEGAAGEPIGRCSYIKAYADRIVAKTIFMGAELSAEADRIFRMYQEGFLCAFSVSFAPDEGTYGPPTSEELKRRPELNQCRCVYRSWELLEYSAVTIPGNPAALAEAVSRGLMPAPTPSEPSGPSLPPLVGRTLEQVERAMRHQIQGQAGPISRQAVQDALDLARGRV